MNKQNGYLENLLFFQNSLSHSVRVLESAADGLSEFGKLTGF